MARPQSRALRNTHGFDLVNLFRGSLLPSRSRRLNSQGRLRRGFGGGFNISALSLGISTTLQDARISTWTSPLPARNCTNGPLARSPIQPGIRDRPERSFDSVAQAVHTRRCRIGMRRRDASEGWGRRAGVRFKGFERLPKSDMSLTCRRRLRGPQERTESTRSETPYRALYERRDTTRKERGEIGPSGKRAEHRGCRTIQ